MSVRFSPTLLSVFSMVPWLAAFIKSADPAWAAKCATALASAYTSGYEDMLSLLQHSGGTGLLDKRGMIYAYESVAGRDGDRGGFDKRAAHGFTMEYLSGDELHEMEPALSPRFKAAIFCPDHGMTFDPEAVVKNLAEGFVRDGGAIMAASVTGLIHDGPAMVGVETDEGPALFDSVVVAAGAWSAKIAAMVEDHVLLEAERGYHVTAPNHGIEMKAPATWAEKKVVMTPMKMGLRLAGTAEFGGLDAPPVAVPVYGADDAGCGHDWRNRLDGASPGQSGQFADYRSVATGEGTFLCIWPRTSWSDRRCANRSGHR